MCGSMVDIQSAMAENRRGKKIDQIESIQKRAKRIIHNPTVDMPYISALTYADLQALKHRRETEARELFKKILSLLAVYTTFSPTA